MLWPVQDATISAWSLNELGAGNHGSHDNLWVRQPGVASTLVQFDLSVLPQGAQIVQGALWLYSPSASNSIRLYMTAYPLVRPWAEYEVDWLNSAAGAPWQNAGATGDTGAADHGAAVGWEWIDGRGWAVFDLDPALLAEWLAEPESNHGLLVRGEGSPSRKVQYQFLSREGGSAAAYPRLVVGYDLDGEALAQLGSVYTDGLLRPTSWLPLLVR
jgi:hypothetical protein